MKYTLSIILLLGAALSYGQTNKVLKETGLLSYLSSNLLNSSKPNLTNDLSVRPFITDDARVVGHRLAQLETWVRLDKESGQHWILGAYRPNEKLELTAGGVYGYEQTHESKKTFSYALPLLQAKYLFRAYQANIAPWMGMVVGTFLPPGERFIQTCQLRNIWLPDPLTMHWER